MLSYLERKGRLPTGAGARVAEAHAVSDQTVSQVLKGTLRHPAIEQSLYRLMREPGTTTFTRKVLTRADVFGASPPKSMRRRRAEVVA